MTEYTPRKVNELKLDVARKRAGTQGLGYDKVLADVVLLLEEVAGVKRADKAGEPPQLDLELVEHLMRKYGVTT